MSEKNSLNGARLGFVLDPIESFNIKKDSSLAMIEAAQDRGADVWYIQQLAMSLVGDKVVAQAQKIRINLQASPWYALSDMQELDLSELDAIFMRKDPPFDINYIYSTYFLERLEQQGVLIVNKPSSLRDCNEKLFATQFPQCCPPLLVSADQERLREFHQQHFDVIYKPLDGMGGSSIFRAKSGEHNLGVILETLTDQGRIPIMAQKYLPEILQGDKRILVVDGEPVSHCLARIPAQGETRGNLAAGGRGVVQELSARDRWIVSQVADDLKARGLIFVGLDVIGDYLTEINVTSPTCIREIDREAGTDIAGLLMDAVEKRLG